jgi:hypothetical protein
MEETVAKANKHDASSPLADLCLVLRTVQGELREVSLSELVYQGRLGQEATLEPSALVPLIELAPQPPSTRHACKRVLGTLGSKEWRTLPSLAPGLLDPRAPPTFQVLSPLCKDGAIDWTTLIQEATALYAELNATRCLLCESDAPSVNRLPCEHSGFCSGCTQLVQRCPICNQHL